MSQLNGTTPSNLHPGLSVSHFWRRGPRRRLSGRALAVAAGIVTAGVVGLGAMSYRAIQSEGPARESAKVLYRRLRSGYAGVYAAALPAVRERAAEPAVVYADAPGEGWQDWSWAQHDLRHSKGVFKGQYAVSWLPEDWKGVYFHHDGLSTAGYGELEVRVYGGSAADVNARVIDSAGKWSKEVPLKPRLQAIPEKPGWATVRILLRDLGVAPGGVLTGVVFQAGNTPAPTQLVLDEIRLLPDTSLPAPPTSTAVAVSIDASKRRPISPLIYGVAHAPKAFLNDQGITLHRWGGNPNSRHNWEVNAWNTVRDWKWNNYGGEWKQPGEAADAFIRDSRNAGADVLITVPALGWVARDTDQSHFSEGVPTEGSARLTPASEAISGYDPTRNRQRTSLRSVARKGSAFQYPPDLADGIVYQDEWLNHLVTTHGRAASGGARFYAVDNEPDLWDQTHTDVHPARMGYDGVLSTFLEYATAIKSVDPGAQVTGPVSWGWAGYFYSALDRGTDNFRTHADRQAHGGEPFLPWFLKQVREHDQKTGRRTLDVLDVHYYPQANKVHSGESDATTRALRLRSVRSLWDPGYTDESWINEPIRLIPRLKEWVAQSYPGTRVGITEWNFGGDQDISGGLAIADTLGVFGREGVELACYWTHPPADSPGALAFALYRNPDGKQSGGLPGFGDLSCPSTVPVAEVDRLSCHAAIDKATGDLTLILINKLPKTAITASCSLNGFVADRDAPMRTWALVEGEKKLQKNGEARISGDGRTLSISLPPYSATLVRVPSVARVGEVVKP